VRARLALCFIGAAWLMISPCHADQSAAIDYLNGCLKDLPARPKPGLDQLKSFCPDLERVLQDAGVTQQLGENWEKLVNARTLRDISALLQRYQNGPASAIPQTGSVHSIAESLRGKQAPPTWWHRLGEWLRHLLERKSGQGPGLVERILQSLGSMSPRVRQAVLYGSLALVLLLLGWIAWREVKAAGITRRSALLPKPGGRPLPSGSNDEALVPGSLDTVSLAERPALLLRLLVQALHRMGRLAGDRALTHRELIARARFDNADQRTRFAGVSLRAEQQLYGAAVSAVADAELERIVHEGRELYLQLLGTESIAS
jgi:hypothetical protein